MPRRTGYIWPFPWKLPWIDWMLPAPDLAGMLWPLERLHDRGRAVRFRRHGGPGRVGNEGAARPSPPAGNGLLLRVRLWFDDRTQLESRRSAGPGDATGRRRSVGAERCAPSRLREVRQASGNPDLHRMCMRGPRVALRRLRRRPRMRHRNVLARCELPSRRGVRIYRTGLALAVGNLSGGRVQQQQVL
jgi:hypothetical protein